MNLYAASSFIGHLLSSRSTAGHGVHSPFMFHLITKVVKGRCDESLVREVRTLRGEMLADRRGITVTDRGAGSVRLKGGERGIAGIASTAALPEKETHLLARMAEVAQRYVKDEGIILELGTSLGISTLAMALAAPGKRVVTIEGCPVLSEIARKNLARHQAHNTEVLNMEFSDALTRLRQERTKVSLAFIDGNHRGEALEKYVTEIMTMGEEMIIVADDIRMNSGMFTAWRSLASSERARAALVTFRLGMLFCLRSLTPGYYRIRY